MIYLYLLQEHHNKFEESIIEGLTELSDEQHSCLWQLLGSTLNTHLACYIAEDDDVSCAQLGINTQQILVNILKLTLCYVNTLRIPKPDDERSNPPLINSELCKMIGVNIIL